MNSESGKDITSKTDTLSNPCKMDISTQQVTESRKNNYYILFNHVPVPMFLFNSNAGIEYSNLQAKDFLKKESQGIRKTFGDILSCINEKGNNSKCEFGFSCKVCVVQNTVKETFETGETQIDIPVRHTFGIDGKIEKEEYFRISTTLLPLVNETGEPEAKVILTIHDETAQKRAEENLIAEQQKAERLKNNFMAQISHEIRTPVNIILSYLSLLEEEPKIINQKTADLKNQLIKIVKANMIPQNVEILKDKIESINFYEDEDNEDWNLKFDAIRRGCKRLIRTIDMMILFAEINAGVAIEKKSHNLNDEIVENLLTIVTKEYDREIEENNIIIKKNIDKNLNIDIDPIFFLPAIQYIMENAIKYNSDKGKVIINGYEEGGKVVLEIRDTGVGMDIEYLETIYEAFSQADNGYARKYDGLGLSLTCTKKVMDVHNSFIEIESEKGKGTIVKIKIPISVEH